MDLLIRRSILGRLPLARVGEVVVKVEVCWGVGARRNWCVGEIVDWVGRWEGRRRLESMRVQGRDSVRDCIAVVVLVE